MSAGAVAGITSVLLVMLMSQPRIFFAMSRDACSRRASSKVHPKFQTPYITTIITCVVVAIAAGLMPIQILGEMTSIGTLFAFVVVCAAVLVLRIKRPDAHRPFKVPGGSGDPGAGHVSCLYLMVSLPVMTWVRFLVWLDIGMLIYWFYGRDAQPAARSERGRASSGPRTSATSSPSPAALVLFNGFCMALLGLHDRVGRDDARNWRSGTSSTRPISRIGLHVNPGSRIASAWRLLGSRRRPRR